MTQKKISNLAASVRQRLFNLSIKKQEDFNLTVIRYALERFLYRLSLSPHCNDFVLKGALLMGIWAKEEYRPTRDLDLLGKGSRKSTELIKKISDICQINVEADGLTFDAASIVSETIRADQEYQGVRVCLNGYLGKIRIAVQIDVGFGDTITPAADKMEYPTLLDFPAPKLKAYPKETVVAEKFETMVKLGYANSRMKDFYDVWILSDEFSFEGKILAKAIRATFEKRKTVMPKTLPSCFSEDFKNAPDKQKQWSAFALKLKIPLPGFAVIVEQLKQFLMPVARETEKNSLLNWDPKKGWR